MYCNNRNGSRAACTLGFVALCAVLAIGLGLMAARVEAAPFAYVTNSVANTVSVIDTPTNKVVATVPAVVTPAGGVAITPDGKNAYVANFFIHSVSVIDTATNKVAATIMVGHLPLGVAITSDGKNAYVTNFFDRSVSVIDTATNTVVGLPIVVGGNPFGVAVAPDGKRAYVANQADGTISVIDTATLPPSVVATVAVESEPTEIVITPDGKQVYVTNDNSSNVSVIDTTTNAVVATVKVGNNPIGVAVTPDGKHVYVTIANGSNPGTVSVIATASNTVVGTPIPVGSVPARVAVTPDGKHAYVTNNHSNSVSVIDTATNTVVATVPVGIAPIGVGIVPPPPGVPFRTFSATRLGIAFDAAPNQDSFALHSLVALSSTAKMGFDPVTQPVTLQVGTFATTIPPGSFTKQLDGSFIFVGVINGVNLEVLIEQAVTLKYRFNAGATGASLTGTKNSVYVTLTIGGASGAASVTARIQGHASPLKTAASARDPI